MISYETYKFVHVIALFTIFAAAGGAAVHAANGGTKPGNAVRQIVAALHGVALLLAITGGFGMLARLSIKHDWLFPGWLWAKIIIWALFGLALMLPYRKPKMAKPLLVLWPFLGAIAAYMAIFKPF